MHRERDTLLIKAALSSTSVKSSETISKIDYVRFNCSNGCRRVRKKSKPATIWKSSLTAVRSVTAFLAYPQSIQSLVIVKALQCPVIFTKLSVRQSGKGGLVARNSEPEFIPENRRKWCVANLVMCFRFWISLKCHRCICYQLQGGRLGWECLQTFCYM